MHVIINASTIEMFERKRKETGARARVRLTKHTEYARESCVHGAWRIAVSRPAIRAHTSVYSDFHDFVSCKMAGEKWQEKNSHRIGVGMGEHGTSIVMYYALHALWFRKIEMATMGLQCRWCHDVTRVKGQNGKPMNTDWHSAAWIFFSRNLRKGKVSHRRKRSALLPIAPLYKI